MKRKVSIVVIGGNMRILQRSQDLDIDVVLVHDPMNAAFNPQCREYCREVIHADFVRDYDSVERAVLDRHAVEPFDRVISLDEDGLVAAARLNQLLGLGGNTLDAVWTLKDKSRMRDRLQAHGFSPTRYAVVRDERTLANFVGEVGGKAILKPVDGVGSVEVHTLCSTDDARVAWTHAQKAGYRTMLAEEFLEGPEYGVETFSHEGQHVVLTMTTKLLRGYLEIGHSLPSAVNASTAAAVSAMVSEFLDLVGLVEGPAHTEVRITGDGPRIIESQNRIGGGRLDDLMKIGLGIDVTRMTASIPLGIEPMPSASPVPQGGAAVRYFVPEPGRITEVLGHDDIPTDSNLRLTLRAQPGDIVREQLTGADRNGLGCFVVAGGKDEADAIHRCEDVMHRVRIVTEPVVTTTSL